MRDILLLGSVPLSNAEEVFRTVAGILGPHIRRIPDGETGWARSVWIQCQIPFFLGNPSLEMVEPDPSQPGAYRPSHVPADGIYSHTQSWASRARMAEGFESVPFSREGCFHVGVEITCVASAGRAAPVVEGLSSLYPFQSMLGWRGAACQKRGRDLHLARELT